MIKPDLMTPGVYIEGSPSEVRSALMATAYTGGQGARGVDGNQPATAFDQGAGRLDV